MSNYQGGEGVICLRTESLVMICVYKEGRAPGHALLVMEDVAKKLDQIIEDEDY